MLRRIICIGLSSMVLCGARTQKVSSLNLDGVRHAVEVSIGSARPVYSDAKPTGTLTVTIRISAHSQSADFSGEVPVKFEDIDLRSMTPFQTVWAQDRCHERRGLPKIWIEHLSGWITENNIRAEVSAEPRQIGLALPDDELKTRQQVAETSIEAGQSVRLITARSSQSQLIADVKLVTTGCVR